MTPTLSTRGAPNLSAIAPANGWPSPQSRFCNASDSANTSRPQPFACDSGVRKKPSDERGPKVRTEIAQPHRARMIGVRHENDLVALGAASVMGISGANANIGCCATAPNQNLVRASIREAHSSPQTKRLVGDWQTGIERAIYVLLELRIMRLRELGRHTPDVFVP